MRWVRPLDRGSQPVLNGYVTRHFSDLSIWWGNGTDSEAIFIEEPLPQFSCTYIVSVDGVNIEIMLRQDPVMT
jgi:hypothetical protein